MAFKKKHPKFNVPNYGAKNRKRVKERWRKQRGEDNKKRIKKAFMGAEPTIGYRNPDSVRGVRSNGRRLEIVHNGAKLSALIERSKSVEVDIAVAKSVGKRKRAEIKAMAAVRGFNVINVR